jgi:hypothetical protein
MMRVHVHHFATEVEAAAFADGVETYSKDGIATCWQKGQEGPNFRVAIHDNRPIGPDGEPFDDPFDVACVVFPDSTGNDICPLCGSSDRAEPEGVCDE